MAQLSHFFVIGVDKYKILDKKCEFAMIYGRKHAWSTIAAGLRKRVCVTRPNSKNGGVAGLKVALSAICMCCSSFRT
ncbi:MAG: hypothetical protein A3G46_01725 [Candidatus Zambryskibacteria bacterium RIFCSPLOWO2_12_FULL_39_16]|uniref:Uncharacterized protein n=1 Tax=Candidatus Zambryskibacteria bacterium RIFCSPLOWO2_12_FULL_39_16 TaxID=1802775 RepID=A0A1G2UU75_9BACT|nr:MAG: hypothetical protein A3G46_01725 [Candidatus Zambryskibacteria bacterium RIFCSPLOWO2_12_FULL_39_16]